jgi:hypothetical protein
MLEEKGVRGEEARILPCKQRLYLPLCDVTGPTTIRYFTEALRTHPRRSHGTLGMCSPLKLNLVRYLVSTPWCSETQGFTWGLLEVDTR